MNSGEKYYKGYFICFVQKREDQNVYFATVAGKKRLKQANKRNRAKRVFRHAIRKVMNQKEIRGVNIVLVALTDFTKIKSTTISDDLMKIL